MPKFDADRMLEEALEKHGNILGILVAETAIWANPAVHHRLIKQTGNAAKYPHIRRARGKGEKRGQTIDGIRLDDNTYANKTIKWAIGGQELFKGYEACHIWDGTCYSEKYHTVIANLVLVPRALAGITDHHAPTKRILQYRAYKIYDWYPDGKDQPTMPEPYVSCWREPAPDRLDDLRKNHEVSPRNTNRPIEEKIEKWSKLPNSNVYKIISIAVQNEGMPFHEFVTLVEEGGFSKNASGALRSLMTDGGNAYGSVLMIDGSGNVFIKPEIRPIVARYRWGNER